jgi:hypothetical protein
MLVFDLTNVSRDSLTVPTHNFRTTFLFTLVHTPSPEIICPFLIVQKSWPKMSVRIPDTHCVADPSVPPVYSIVWFLPGSNVLTTKRWRKVFRSTSNQCLVFLTYCYSHISTSLSLITSQIKSSWPCKWSFKLSILSSSVVLEWMHPPARIIF